MKLETLMRRDSLPAGRILAGLFVGALLRFGDASASAADATWVGPLGVPSPWLIGTNWSSGVFPGETSNASSLNTDVATITNAQAFYPVLQADFSPSGANGQLALGAIVLNRSQFGLISATVRPVVNGGTLTLNGATVNGVPNTILGNRGTASDTFFFGDANARFAAVRLGSTVNVVQLGARKWISISAVISERNPGSGITLTSDTGEALVEPGGLSAGLANTFSGTVRIEKGARWDLGLNPQAFGLSTPDAQNLILNNGVIRGRATQIGRLFTLGPGGGKLEAFSFSSPPTAELAFINTGAIASEGAGPRTLILAGEGSAFPSSYGFFAPAIGDAPDGGKTSLVKTNWARWTLMGANTYSGDTTIGPGALVLSGSGSFANSPTINLVGGDLGDSFLTNGANHDGVRFALAAGQTVTGYGSIFRPMSVRDGSTIAPVDMQTRDLIFTAPNAVMAVKVDLGPTLNAGLLRVWNAGLDLGGATLNVSLLNAPATPGSTQTFLLIDNDGTDAVTNQFGTINLSGVNASGYDVTVDYAFTGTDSLGRVGDGNDLAITLAPATEPSAFSLSISVTNGIATLTWPSVSDQTYWVQYKTALTNANWDDLPGEVIATGPSASKTDTTGTETRFYRVKTQ